MHLSSARWACVEAAFAQAVELESGERDAFCVRAANGDEDVLMELRSLLEAHACAAPWVDDHLVRPLPEAVDPRELLAGPAMPRRAGAWLIGALIGRGGSGEVHLATRADGHFEQRVALKLLIPDVPGQLDRFRAERQVLARLEHPGIARLLDGGMAEDGREYAVMEYVDGMTLMAHCAEHHATLHERLDLFVQICEAVSHAHQNLIVHRDLKPGNIMVTHEGRIKLLDFGIAKRVDLSEAMARHETLAPLTPDYASPEQVTGAPVTTATDVYALGMVLFELLTGDRPWPGMRPSLARAVQLIVNATPPLASVAARSRAHAPVPPLRLKGDLDCIVAKCVRKEPSERYATVNELQRDVENHLAHRPVRARAGESLYVLARAMRRHLLPTVAGLAMLVSLGVGIGVAAAAARRAAVERDIAQAAATREEAVRLYLTNMFRGAIAEHSGNTVDAKGMLDQSARRVIDQYKGDPKLTGRMVMTLANLYGALQDDEGQAPLLEAYLSAAGRDADPESLAAARQALAQVELERGHAARCAELLRQSDSFWDGAPDRYREQHLEALGLHGRLWRAQGKLPESIRTYREAIDGRLRAGGPDQRELGNLYNSLAITLMDFGEATQALAAYRSATQTYERLGMGQELGPLVILANTGTLAYRTGHLAEAQDILQRSVDGQRRRGGESASLAAAVGSLGAVMSERGELPQAGPVLQEANSIASRVTDAASPLAVQNRLYMHVWQSRTAPAERVLPLVDQNLATARERLGPRNLMTERVRLFRAGLLLDMHRMAEAEGEFDALIAALTELGQAGELWRADALVGKGDVLMARGKVQAALDSYQAALQIRQRLLWQDSWRLAQVKARIGEALVASGRGDAGRAMAREAAERLSAQLGVAHPETLRAHRVAGRGAFHVAVELGRPATVCCLHTDYPGAFECGKVASAISPLPA